MMRMHCQTSGVSLSEQAPYNNIVRTTIEALAGVLGGTQSLHTNAFDEAHALPSEASAKIARDTQLIIQHETGLTDVVDPLGGSYYVEALTRETAASASSILGDIERIGGMTAAVQAGMPTRLIEESALRRQARRDSARDVVVGVNRYTSQNAEVVATRRIDTHAVVREQTARLVALRASRDGAAVRSALDALRAGARSDANLLALAVTAARARCTLGEISRALEDVFGRHRQPQVLRSGVYRKASVGDPRFAEACASVAAFARARGRAPRMLVAKLGQDGHDRGAKVIGSAFTDAGFTVHMAPLFQSPDEIVALAERHDVDVIGISSLCAGHDALLPLVLARVAERGLDVKVVLGGIVPASERAALIALGVAAFFPPTSDTLACVRAVIALLEGDAAAEIRSATSGETAARSRQAGRKLLV